MHSSLLFYDVNAHLNFPTTSLFYFDNIVKEDVKPIASAGITRTLTVVLYLLAIGVFAGLWVFYSDKSQWVSKSLTLSEYSRAGFKCVPLQGMDLHGLTGTMMTYDDCLNTVEPVNDTNVVKQDNDFVYKWTTGGVASYASSTAETVSNPTWEKEGYVCHPSRQSPIYGLLMNYNECLTKLRSLDDGVTIHNPGMGCLRYIPFAETQKFYTWVSKDSDRQTCNNCIQAKNSGLGHGWGYDFDGFESLESSTPCDSGDVAADKKEKVLANTKACFDDGSCNAVCDHFKDANAIGPFTCTKTSSNDVLPTTHDQAVTYYKKNYAPDALCAPLKENAPFQCTGSEPKSAAEILSLSYANTQLAFSAFGSIFVLILYKCKKAKAPDFLQEDELLDELTKLKADNAALKKAMEEENAAIKEDNAAMKKAMEATNEAIKRLEEGKLKADNPSMKKAMEEENAAIKEDNTAMKKAMEEENAVKQDNAAMKKAMEQED